MKEQLANYEIAEFHDDYIVIRDLGPWDQFMTVTNAAEVVVNELFRKSHLKDGQRLFYFASDNSFDEIVIHKKQFHGFRPGRRP